jgi:hypothetical protein
MITEQQAKPVEASVIEDTSQLATPKKSNKGLLVFVILAVIISLSTTLYLLFQPAKEPQLLPSPVVVQPLILELLSPADGELAVNREILVSGTTLPNTPVVIFTETDETSIDADSSGKFETTLSLDDGINTLVITAYGEDGGELTKSVDIVYDPES